MDCKEKLLNRVKERDLYFGGSGLPDSTDSIGVDFALLANCNHTIESHGSFSYFAGAFAGGFKVKPNHFSKYRELRHKKNIFWSKSPFKHPLPRISSFWKTEFKNFDVVIFLTYLVFFAPSYSLSRFGSSVYKKERKFIINKHSAMYINAKNM